MRGIGVLFGILVLVQTIFVPETVWAGGKEIFQAKCASCHTIGGGRLVGPDLSGITERRSEDWLRSMIKDPATMVANDPEAKALLQEYQVPMPNLGLTDAEVQEIVSYLQSGSESTTETEKKSEERLAGDPVRGAALFSGRMLFTNGGPACISCHSVKSSQVLLQGGLAKDLTDASLRLGIRGVEGVLSGLPFPAMKEAYGKRTVTPQEAADIAAFLEQTGLKFEMSPIEGKFLFIAGGGGTFLLLVVIFPLLWHKRRRQSVNQKIFDRQIRSRN